VKKKLYFCVVFSASQASKVRKQRRKHGMNEKEKNFERLVQEQKSTIYAVCYMFSSDEDEAADLFQESLMNLWKGFDGFEGRSSLAPSWACLWAVA